MWFLYVATMTAVVVLFTAFGCWVFSVRRGIR